MSSSQEYAQQNREKLQLYKEQFFAVLDDYKKSYVTAHLYPSVDEYKYTNQTILSQLEKIASDLFSMLNTLQQKIQVIKKELSEMNDDIVINKKKNESLLLKYQNIEAERNGSTEMLTDSKTMFNEQYYSNLYIILGILLVLFFFYYLFRSTPSTNANANASSTVKT
jgi:hypothetical protein